MESRHVVVIGAGIVGAASALELLRDGHRVTILDPGAPGGVQAASFGNGAWISTASVLPVTAPGVWRKVPGWLRDPLGPLTIRWRYLPRLLPWLIRFLRAGSSWAKVEAIAQSLRPLVADAPERHLRLAQEAGVADLIQRTGLLYIFPTRADFEAEANGWRIRAATGVRWIELTEDELRQREPALDRRYTFAVLVEDGAHCTDPGAYVAALATRAVAFGAVLRHEQAVGFRIEGGRLRAVTTDRGEIACDAAVIAAGARARALAAAAGDAVPLETERGYHVTIASLESGPRHPVMPSDGHMVETPLRGGLRVAGQVEFAGLDAPPDWRRAETLKRHALRSFPGLPRDLPPDRVSMWMGRRPSIPDGLPCIGPATATADILHAYGHGHIGLSAGAMTGRLVADLIGGSTPVIDPAPYRPQRFRRGG